MLETRYVSCQNAFHLFKACCPLWHPKSKYFFSNINSVFLPNLIWGRGNNLTVIWHQKGHLKLFFSLPRNIKTLFGGSWGKKRKKSSSLANQLKPARCAH